MPKQQVRQLAVPTNTVDTEQKQIILFTKDEPEIVITQPKLSSKPVNAATYPQLTLLVDYQAWHLGLRLPISNYIKCFTRIPSHVYKDGEWLKLNGMLEQIVSNKVMNQITDLTSAMLIPSEGLGRNQAQIRLVKKRVCNEIDTSPDFKVLVLVNGQETEVQVFY